MQPESATPSRGPRRPFNPLDYPICYTYPERMAHSAWVEHIPFGMYLVAAARPRLLVELGTYRGVSYCAFCQAVKQLGLETRCFGIDAWRGDAHQGYYGPEILEDLRQHHDPRYGNFSRLTRSKFEDVVANFADGSIDVCHIDGYHRREAVQQDVDQWLPKLSRQGILLLHDTNVRERDFGVWQVWASLKDRYPSFEFVHGHGLGVLAVGEQMPPDMEPFFLAAPDEKRQIQEFFFNAGERLALWQQLGLANELTAKQAAALAQQEGRLAQLEAVRQTWAYHMLRVYETQGWRGVARRAWGRLKRTVGLRAKSAPG